MKLLILQHEPTSPMGTTRLWLDTRKIEAQLLHMGLEELPDPELFDGLIALGGEMNVDQETLFPWLIQEKKYLKDWIHSNKPLVGLCLGGQLIAEVLGAPVRKHQFWEIGWSELSILSDSRLPKAGSTMPAFQWHGYIFEQPEGSQLTMKGTHWQNQGFSYRENVHAFQFHPEVTEEFMLECALAQKERKNFSRTEQTYDEILKQKENLKTVRDWYFSFLDSVFLKNIN